jgi:hypothetical protein
MFKGLSFAGLIILSTVVTLPAIAATDKIFDSVPDNCEIQFSVAAVRTLDTKNPEVLAAAQLRAKAITTLLRSCDVVGVSYLINDITDVSLFRIIAGGTVVKAGYRYTDNNWQHDVFDLSTGGGLKPRKEAPLAGLVKNEQDKLVIQLSNELGF